VCGSHTGFNFIPVICTWCTAEQDTARNNIIEKSVLDSTGLRQIVAALSVPSGLSNEVFNYFRSRGVGFRTHTPWDEVKALYREYPIHTGAGTQYHLKIRRETAFGWKEASYDLAHIPALYMQTLSSEGYISSEGLVTAQGTVLTRIPERLNDDRVIFSSTPIGPMTRGSGLKLLPTLKVVNSYRHEVDLRVQQHQSVCMNDWEARRFIDQMLSIWKHQNHG